MNQAVLEEKLKTVASLDEEGEVEFNDEHPLEMRLFQYMNDLVGTNYGFKLEAQSKVSSLYLKGETGNKLICKLDENQRCVYFFPGIGNMLNKTLPKEEMRNKLLTYKRELIKENYQIYAIERF